MSGAWQHIPRMGRQVARIFPMKQRKQLRLALVREGCANRPFYTIHVKYNITECKQPGLEQIGSWDPFPNQHGEQLLGINMDRLTHWLSKGAHPTDTVAELLGMVGILPVHPRSYLSANRCRTRGSTGLPVPGEEVKEAEEGGEERSKGLPWRLDLR